MAFALLFIGIALIVVTARNTQATFTARVANDFTGPGNFFFWIISIAIVGAVGFIPKFKNVSDLFLVLLLLAVFLQAGKNGAFTQFTAAILQTTGTTPETPQASTTNVSGQIAPISTVFGSFI
jgi:hypothetical protein